MDNSVKDVSELIKEWYVPTSIERRKAFLMYIIIGMITIMMSKKITKYEKFHLKQSIWWWTIFFMLLVCSVFFIFLPYIKVIPFLIFLTMFLFWGYFVYQAWNWIYTTKSSKIIAPFFFWIGAWILEVTEIEFDQWDEIQDQKDNKNNHDNWEDNS